MIQLSGSITDVEWLYDAKTATVVSCVNDRGEFILLNVKGKSITMVSTKKILEEPIQKLYWVDTKFLLQTVAVLGKSGSMLCGV